MAAPIEIIKYPFSGGAALNRSFAAPEIVEALSQDILNTKIKRWHTLPDFKVSPSTRRHKGLRNYGAVKEAVSTLGIAIGRTLLISRAKPLSLGGDHTQGIATVKATTLALVVQEIMDGSLPLRHKGMLTKITNAAKDGNVLRLATLICEAVHSQLITQKALRTCLDTIAVIWIDSHPDYNDRHSSPSGNIHGMSMAACAGRDIGGIEDLFAGDVLRLNPQNFYVLCARDIDENERRLMDQDGVQYRRWELTTPGAMRTHADPDTPVSLKIALERLMKTLNKKKLILSLDIDAIHAGPHKSAYGTESVAATGTPMGIKRRDVKRLFSAAAAKHSKTVRRLNENNESPPGPGAGDVFEAIQNIMNRKNVVAADLSEISPAAGERGSPIAENIRGLTLQTGIRVLAAMVGADLKKVTSTLEAEKKELNKRVRAAIKTEKSKA